MRQVILSPGEDGYWVVEVPSLPGCISQGKTREEALMNIKEAIEGYTAALKENSLPLPEEPPRFTRRQNSLEDFRVIVGSDHLEPQRS